MDGLNLSEERWLVLLIALDCLEGAGTKADVLDWIDSKKLHLVSKEDARLVKSGEPAWRNYLAWERNKLVNRGAMPNVARNDWRITELGRDFLGELIRKIDTTTNFSYINPTAIDVILNRGLAVSSEFPWAGEVEFVEGSKSLVWTVRYERSSDLRAAAIEIHGLSCQCCEFNFENAYGELGSGFIEVHHTKPVSAMNGHAIVSASEDMVVLCSNCHRMVHRQRGNPMTVGELRAALVKSK